MVRIGGCFVSGYQQWIGYGVIGLPSMKSCHNSALEVKPKPWTKRAFVRSTGGVEELAIAWIDGLQEEKRTVALRTRSSDP